MDKYIILVKYKGFDRMRTRSGSIIHQNMMKELAETYQKQGYTTVFEARVNDGWVDVLAIKNGEKIGIECMVIPNYKRIKQKISTYTTSKWQKEPYLTRLIFAFPKNTKLKKPFDYESTLTTIIRPKPKHTNLCVDDAIEAQIRTYIRRKGDLGRIVNEALELWLGEKQK